MDKAAHKKKSCESKVRYASVTEAQQEIRWLKAKKINLYFYECKYCGGVHLTRTN